jgi:dolichol kinase
MSKERARRRAEREAEQARQAARVAEREAKLVRRRQRVGRVTALLPGRPVRIASQGGIIARRRRAQNGGVAVLFMIVQVIAWLLWSSWTARFGVFVLSLLFVPLIVTLVFDRRS